LKGLEALHAVNVLHRDIKSANIFLTKDQAQVKLADMNVSIVTANGMARTQTGTPYYASPEVWQEKPYSSKCDVWSLGCVLYELAALKPPFVSHDLKSLKKTIISGVYKRLPGSYSDDLEAFIRLCLKVDPKERLSASDLLENELLLRRTGK
jgi:NIMA (never in mitosis gene a)-related kinase